jgi:hypothetical protein
MKNLKYLNIYKLLITSILLNLVFISCDNYLDVEPKGVQLLKTVRDYDQWLNSNEALGLNIPEQLNLLADITDNRYVTNPPVYTSDRIYTWQPRFSDDLNASPVIWESLYKSIYYYNTVLKGIDNATEGSQPQKNSLKAEALLGRSLQYLYLVNLYGKTYNSGSANQDLAVPFVISNDLNDPTPERSTVQQIYDHIILDIKAALPNLAKNNGGNVHRGSLAAGYSVLARTYLYMGDFAKASQNAQLALDNGPDTVLDYSALNSDYDIPALNKRPDVIYARLSGGYYNAETPTLAFLKSFDTTDLRLKFFYDNLGNYSFTERFKTSYRPNGVSFGQAFPNWGTSVAEMRLIIAESAVRANNLTTALNQLHLVRKARFNPADYLLFTSSDKAAVLQKVLAERSLEFPYCGLRWFDMRRLDAEGLMPEVKRYTGTGELITTLPPASTKYTLQIPIQIMYFNPGWKQNPY